MMTIDEAIKHCEEKAEELKKQYGELANKRPEPIEEQMRLLSEKHECWACAEEHEQLARWLRELKWRREEADDMMTIDEAIQVLMEHRPERPYKTEGRRLQVAIDTVVEEIRRQQRGETI